MGKRYVLLDDYDGKELPDTTDPLTLTVGGESWNLYLSEKSHQAMMKALDPFTKDAEKATAKKAATRKSSNQGGSINTYGHDPKTVREWAITNKKINANGKPVGPQGRLSQAIYEDYNKNKDS